MFKFSKVCIVFSSPEHEVIRVSSVVRRQHLLCSPSRGHRFVSIFMKLYKNVCLGDISRSSSNMVHA